MSTPNRRKETNVLKALKEAEDKLSNDGSNNLTDEDISFMSRCFKQRACK